MKNSSNTTVVVIGFGLPGHREEGSEIGGVRGDDNETKEPPGRCNQTARQVLWGFACKKNCNKKTTKTPKTTKTTKTTKPTKTIKTQ